MASTLAATNGCTSAGPLRLDERMTSASISSSVGRGDAARVAGVTSTHSEGAHDRLNPGVQCLLRGLPHPFDTVQRNLSSDRRNNPLTDDIGGDNVLIPIRPPLRRQRGSTLDVTEAKVRRVVADRQCR